MNDSSVKYHQLRYPWGASWAGMMLFCGQKNILIDTAVPEAENFLKDELSKYVGDNVNSCGVYIICKCRKGNSHFTNHRTKNSQITEYNDNKSPNKKLINYRKALDFL